ncbi:EF-hand domain-containing protein [Xinfangfangia sp. D13-10-4-6]|uniref:EF-hand domain-containing protein n=1 Tax=Pseudogemmobacter hezensis TaxID=2737662 RepID=UPI001552D722|nr:EF-hand domain-containing protein [Pseudogemmobacter hezensis]NPD14517.1 EF-hand domain-containing protein [Pseudogemmobacter hezensis]
MKRMSLRAMALVATSASLIAGAAMAQTSLPLIEDADGSGDWSLAELQTLWPELTQEGFVAIDTDANGAVSPEELQLAVDNGLVQLPQQ